MLDGPGAGDSVYSGVMRATLIPALCLAALSPLAAWSDEPAAPIDLDKLLRPPTSVSGPAGLGVPTVPRTGAAPTPRSLGGRTASEWRETFDKARSEVTTLDDRVRGGQEQLREASRGEYSYSPPGAGQASDPQVVRIRAELRRDRQSLETARRRLRDLEVEASLAGVPDEWRHDPVESPSPVGDAAEPTAQ